MPGGIRIVPIVEGKGEVTAVPILLRRIALLVAPSVRLEVARPIRVARDRFLRREGELDRYLNLAAVNGGRDARILVLLDADDACPAELGPRLLAQARKARSDRQIEVVLPCREYESWFLAALGSLLPAAPGLEGASAPPNAEAIRGAKERLRLHMSYRPTADQARLTARMDLDAVRSRSRSFSKLWRAVSCLLAGDSTS